MADPLIPPAGLVEAGTWEPGELPAPYRPTASLADAVSPVTREVRSIRTGAHPIDAAVQFALSVVAGKAPAIPNAGTSLEAIRKIRSSAPTEVAYEVAFALRRLVARGAIRVDKILVGATLAETGADDMVAAIVQYTNLLSGEPREAEVLR
jgi:hypothetical protein